MTGEDLPPRSCLEARVIPLWLTALGVCLGLLLVGRSAPDRPGATETAPATASASVLAAGARQKAQQYLERLGEGFGAVVEPPFVVVGNLPAEDLQRITRDSVLAPARAMWASYFRQRPTEVLTLLLLKDQSSYRHWAKELFGDVDVSPFGYYKRTERTQVMDIATGTGTLVHELTHALIVYDFPDVPVWFNEGLASLHEQCQVGSEEIVGLPNWRLPALQQAVRDKTLRPLRDLVTRDDFYGSARGLNYAQARYFVMYLQQQGVLKKFYRHFRDNHEGTDPAVRGVEQVFGRSFEAVEGDFLKWVMTLRFP